MIIELERAISPSSMHEIEACGLCGEDFRPESIVASVMGDEREHIGWACPPCIGMMGRRNSKRFPTMEEYEAAKRLYPTPIWESTEEADRIWQLDGGETHDEILNRYGIEREIPEHAAGFGPLTGERSELFVMMRTHLDLVASMDEEDHGGSAAARHIREVLIPFCAQEGGLPTDEEQWAAHFRERRG